MKLKSEKTSFEAWRIDSNNANFRIKHGSLTANILNAFSHADWWLWIFASEIYSANRSDISFPYFDKSTKFRTSIKHFWDDFIYSMYIWNFSSCYERAVIWKLGNLVLSLSPTPMLDQRRGVAGFKRDQKVAAPLFWSFELLKRGFVDKDSFHGIIWNKPIINIKYWQYILVKYTIIKFLPNLKMQWSILKFMKILNLFWR